MNKLIILDRDGVINEATPWKFCADWEDWKWTHRAPWAMQALITAGYKLVIVTNQNGIANGYYTEDDYAQLMNRAAIDAIKLTGVAECWPTVICQCPHDAEANCQGHKPGILSWTAVIYPKFKPVSLAESWVVGDRDTDMEYGRRIGLRTAKIPEDFTSLHHFAELLLGITI